MNLNLIDIVLGTICLAGAAVYVIARWKEIDGLAVVAKIAASTSFVVLALANGAVETVYGRLILAALLLSWLGDLLLLSLRSSFLLAGIASFLAGHIAFAAAFAMNDLSTRVFFIAFAAAAVLAVAALGWLWKYLQEFYRIAVPLYLAAITIMVSLAVAAAFESMPVTVAVGATAFAISDLSVARDRFIERSVANKAWGLPLYYLAQVLLAGSVAAAG